MKIDPQEQKLRSILRRMLQLRKMNKWSPNKHSSTITLTLLHSQWCLCKNRGSLYTIVSSAYQNWLWLIQSGQWQTRLHHILLYRCISPLSYCDHSSVLPYNHSRKTNTHTHVSEVRGLSQLIIFPAQEMDLLEKSQLVVKGWRRWSSKRFSKHSQIEVS